MLSRNLVIASVAVVFLVSTVSTAPVEDKEPEENDFEAEEGEEELSEEEEDDDDSKAQHMKGVGSQQATSAPKGSGSSASPGSSGESPNGHKINGAIQTGQVSSSSMLTSSDGSSGSHGRDGYSRPSASSSHGSSNSGQDGSKSETVSPAGGAGGAGAHGALASKVPGPDVGVHTISISVVSSGQGSPGHISAGHVIGRPSAGQTSGVSAAVSSEVQSQPSGSEVTGEHTEGYENGESAHETSQIESPEIPETESNGHGHKQLMNGGETSLTDLEHFMPGTSQIHGAGGFDTFGTSPHLEITGIIDQSNHDFLVGLMGGVGEDFGADVHTAGLGTLSDSLHTPDPPSTCLVTDAVSTDQIGHQVDSTAAGLGPGHPSSSSLLDVPPDSTRAAPPSAYNGNNDISHSISRSENGAPAGTTDSSFMSDTLENPGHFFTDYSDGGMDNNADGHEINGNGRHKPVVEIQKGTEHQSVAMETHHTAVDTLDHTLSPYADATGHDIVTGASAQTDTADGQGEPVTDGNIPTDITGRGHLAVTDGFPKHTDPVYTTGAGYTDPSQTQSDGAQTDLQATGDPSAASSQTDVTGTATAEPQGTLGGPTGRPGATEPTQTAVPAGEQYHTSGQGPEGAENVELEDTC